MQQLGWATCQRLSPNPDTLFYKFSNDVPVHRLFLHLRCDERSTLTHPVPSLWHASSRYTDIDKSSISQVIVFLEKSQTQQPAFFLPLGHYGLFSCIRIAILIFLAPGRVFFSDMAPRAVFHFSYHHATSGHLAWCFILTLSGH